MYFLYSIFFIFSIFFKQDIASSDNKQYTAILK